MELHQPLLEGEHQSLVLILSPIVMYLTLPASTIKKLTNMTTFAYTVTMGDDEVITPEAALN